MATAEWTLEGDHGSQILTLDHDSSTGKVFLRVDGRAVTRPLAEGESQRAFSWGGNDYVMRKVHGDWDLQFVQATPITNAPLSAGPSKPMVTAHGFSGGGIIKLVLLLVVIAGVVSIVRYVGRWTSPWVPYAKDNRFAVSFPVEPTRKGNPSLLTLTAVNPKRPQHFEFSFVQVPMLIEAAQADAYLTEVIDRYVSKHKGTVTKKETGYFSQNDALFFDARLGASNAFPNGSHLRAIAAYQGNRVYVAAFTSEGSPAGVPEATRFFSSIKLGVYETAPGQ